VTDSVEPVSMDSDKDIDTSMDWTLTSSEHMTKTFAVSGSQVYIWSKPQGTWNSDGDSPFSGGPSGLRIQ
jgi:hypothetical protein